MKSFKQFINEQLSFDDLDDFEDFGDDLNLFPDSLSNLEKLSEKDILFYKNLITSDLEYDNGLAEAGLNSEGIALDDFIKKQITLEFGTKEVGNYDTETIRAMYIILVLIKTKDKNSVEFAVKLSIKHNLEIWKIINNVFSHDYHTTSKKIDLSNANLKGIDFCKATLRGVDLSEANLSNANLSNTSLYESDLSNADLSNADLSGSECENTDFRGADLTNADLSNVDLSNADLSYADLTNADLTGAKLMETIFYDANLTNTTFDSELYFSGYPPKGIDHLWSDDDLYDEDGEIKYY
jgi:hypothetical protein